MSSFRKAVSLLLAGLMLANFVGCTKRVAVPAEQYGEVIGGEEFIHVTTTSGDVFQLQEAQLTEVGISGLLRHEKGDVRPAGMGGRDERAAYVEIRHEDVASVEIERINKKRLLVIFGLVGAGIIGAITLVEARGDSGDDGAAGGEPGGKPPF